MSTTDSKAVDAFLHLSLGLVLAALFILTFGGEFV